MPSVLLCIPPDYDYNFPPLGTPVLIGFLKSKGINAIQRDLNIPYNDFLASRIKGGHLSEFDKRTALKNILRTFFNEKQKKRYYSKLLPRYSDNIFPYLPYDNNSNSSFYFTERILSEPFLFRYLADKKNNTFYQFYAEVKILSLILSAYCLRVIRICFFTHRDDPSRSDRNRDHPSRKKDIPGHRSMSRTENCSEPKNSAE